MTKSNNNVERENWEIEFEETIKKWLMVETATRELTNFIRKTIDTHTADIVGKIKNFDVKNDTMGNPVENPLMRLNDVKAMILEFINRDNK